jgi:predicted RNA binding protein YcfA (HicA-like mRNA interferase family)
MKEVRQLLEELGYEERANPGSHCVFHKKNAPLITIPTQKGTKVKVFYIRRLSEILNLEEYCERQEGD